MNEAYECENALFAAPLALSEEMEEDIINLFSLGMNYANIRQEIKEKYDVNLSKDLFNSATGKLVSAFRQWQQRPLNPVYPVIWLDAIPYNIRQDGRYVSKIVYTLLALNLAGRKEILGVYLAENTDIHFWLSLFVDLQNRGVSDILIACEDNLAGFADALSRVFDQAEVQSCIVHQIRNSSATIIVSKSRREFCR
nr:transposase [uncultured Moellerella sp.]